MDKTQLKKRIVGAVVLVALGVIFIPLILDGEGQSGSNWNTNIPPKTPQVAEVAQQPIPAMPEAPPMPDTRVQQIDEKSAAVLPLPGTAQATAAPETPKKDLNTTQQIQETVTTAEIPSVDTGSKTAAQGWIVQIASFSTRDKALQLRDKLLKQKHKAYVEAVTLKQETLYRVRVGPFGRENEAKAEQEQIARKMNIKGKVWAQP